MKDEFEDVFIHPSSFILHPSQNPARICAVIAEQTIESARARLRQAAAQADIAELRLDYLIDFDLTDPGSLRPLLEEKTIPVIITFRAPEEGGKRRADNLSRLKLLVEGARDLADYCDIEAAHYEEAARLRPDPARLIVSYHNLDQTPDDLDTIYERIFSLPAAVRKIATRANSVTDTLKIFRLIERAESEQRNLIAIAMDGPGLITRLIGPSRGSFLTYGSLGGGSQTAHGQPTCEELRNLFRLDSLTRETAITAIIGRPVAHSASPAMHNAAFGALGLDFVYLPIEVGDAKSFVTRFVRPESREIDWPMRGLSVTIPHKEAIRGLLDEIDPTARKVGAVNTVVVSGDRLFGYNTDARGAVEPLEDLCALGRESCAVIGAGGAARAVVYGLIECGARVTVFAREQRKALSMADSFGVKVERLDRLKDSDASIIINTTPVGMRGHGEGESAVPADLLSKFAVAYDLVYNPVETRFLKDAKAAGCRTIGGIEMLVGQAALQFELWTERKPPIDLMKSAALAWLAGQADA
jgi:3-dehydroquinate dehydratase / shikimate dehydrogenase